MWPEFGEVLMTTVLMGIALFSLWLGGSIVYDVYRLGKRN